MMATAKSRAPKPTERLRIETADNWHKRWPAILPALKKQGAARKLHIDKDGWLSARQVVLVALAGDAVAGHLCFSVAPVASGCVEAKLNSRGIDKTFCGRGIEAKLHRAAIAKARSLRCEQLVGFGLGANWC